MANFFFFTTFQSISLSHRLILSTSFIPQERTSVTFSMTLPNPRPSGNLGRPILEQLCMFSGFPCSKAHIGLSPPLILSNASAGVSALFIFIFIPTSPTLCLDLAKYATFQSQEVQQKALATLHGSSIPGGLFYLVHFSSLQQSSHSFIPHPIHSANKHLQAPFVPEMEPEQSEGGKGTGRTA